jgi:ADP-ribosylglycohydrolase
MRFPRETERQEGGAPTMDSALENVLSITLRRRLKTLGYPSLRKFYADHPGIGLSYETLRQVVYGGHVPRPETLFRILGLLQLSSSQIRKICGMHYGEYLPISPSAGSPRESPAPTSLPADEPGIGPSEQPSRADDGVSPIPLTDDPGEVAARLHAALSEVPGSGNEDFWELVQAVARLAERKARRGAVRQAEQPLLFAGEPEAIYQFLIRKSRVPPFLSHGEPLALEFAEGIPYEDRYRGAMLGAAVGEMLGTLTQGLTPRDVQELYGDVNELPAIRSLRGAPPVPDASPLLAAAHSLLPAGVLDPERAAAALARSVRPDDGPGLHAFARNLLERGMRWHDAAEELSENAPAIYALPVALLRAGAFRRLKLEAGIFAALLSTHPASIAGAITQALAVARTLHCPPGGIDVLSFPRMLAPAISGIEPERGAKPRPARAPAAVGRKLGAELPALLLRRAPVHEMRDALGNGAAAHEGIPFALGCFLRAPGDFAESVVPAVSHGGDARVIAALTGALCGAYAGASGIPQRFLSGLPLRDEITAAADALLALARRDG